MQTSALHPALPGEPVLPVVQVPRIDLHIFCADQQSGQVLQAAAADRRLSKAHTSIQLGGIMAAAQVYQNQATPDLLVVETYSGREQMLAELGALAEVCQASTKVVVIGHVNDVTLYRDLVKAGICEYMVAPFAPAAFIDVVANLYNDPKAAPLGKIISFVGAKGGVGSSTIAHNVSWVISERKHIDTIITDLDLAFGTAALNFNQDAPVGMLEALGQPERVDSTLIDRMMSKLNDKLSLLSGPGGVDRDIAIEPHAVETILNVVRTSAPMIVVDVPNMWAPWIKYTLLNSDEIVITATPELPSLRNAKSLIDLLRQTRANDRAPRLILNQVGVPKRPEISPADFAKAVGVEPMAVIPYDPQAFGQAQSNGQMLFEVAPKSKAADALQSVSDALAGQERAVTGKKSSSSFLANLPFLKGKAKDGEKKK